jgi:glutamyl-tRNA reductase
VAELRHRVTGPVIARLRAELQSVQATELQRLFQRLPNLDEQSRREISRFADRLLGKMLHPPLESLRDESRNGSPHSLLKALERLFQLED